MLAEYSTVYRLTKTTHQWIEGNNFEDALECEEAREDDV